MLSVVLLSDCPKLEFIQPHPHSLFVNDVCDGCLEVGTPRCGVRFLRDNIDQSFPNAAARRPYQSF
jgi:hypothetical protein